MHQYTLHLELLSDATFGRGEGVAGLVDQEVEHDRDGLPYLRGRTLKGLLNEACADVLYALERQNAANLDDWKESAHHLFGGPGSSLDDAAWLRVGDARLPETLRAAVHAQVEAGALKSADVLESLTAIRTQTAVDETCGVPQTGTLRTMRVVLRGTHFEAPLYFPEHVPDANDLALLAACVLALHRAGTGRNRGRGRLKLSLHDVADNPITEKYFAHFAQQITPEAS